MTQPDDDKFVKSELEKLAVYAMGAIDKATYPLTYSREYSASTEVARIRSWAPMLVAARRLIRCGRWEFDRPRVLKKGKYQYVRCGRSRLAVASHLCHGQDRVQFDLASEFLCEPIPQPIHAHFKVASVAVNAPRAVVDHVRAELKRIFLHGLDERADVLKAELEGRWKQLEHEGPEIVRNHFAKRGGMIRKEFRERMVKAVKDCDTMLDEDPEFVLRVMQLTPRELEVLAKFSKRNESDLELVTPDDVREVLDIARVQGVQGS